MERYDEFDPRHRMPDGVARELNALEVERIRDEFMNLKATVENELLRFKNVLSGVQPSKGESLAQLPSRDGVATGSASPTGSIAVREPARKPDCSISDSPISSPGSLRAFRGDNSDTEPTPCCSHRSAYNSERGVRPFMGRDFTLQSRRVTPAGPIMEGSNWDARNDVRLRDGDTSMQSFKVAPSSQETAGVHDAPPKEEDAAADGKEVSGASLVASDQAGEDVSSQDSNEQGVQLSSILHGHQAFISVDGELKTNWVFQLHLFCQAPTASVEEGDDRINLLQPDMSLVVAYLWRIADDKQRMYYDTFKMLLWGLLHPHSGFRIRWDMCMLMCLFYVCLASPYIICFGILYNRKSVLFYLENIVDILFALDVYLNFRTALADEHGNLIEKYTVIADSYIRSWFLIDTVSIIPFERLADSRSIGFLRLIKGARVVKMVKILRLLKLIKMMRILRSPELFKQLEERIGRAFVKICSFTGAAVLLLHLTACFFYYIAFLNNNGPDTWVGEAELEHNNFARYATSLYWAMSTMTTVGYGDVIPVTTEEKLVSMLGMMVGVTVFAYFMGSVSTLLAALNTQTARMAAKKQAVDDFLNSKQMPTPLASKVRKFYNYVLEKQLHGDDKEIVEGLSGTLQEEVVLFLHRSTLEKVPFFKGKHPQFIAQLVTHLKLEFYAAGDYIVKQGNVGRDMFFIAEGMLEVMVWIGPPVVKVDAQPLISNGNKLMAPATMQPYKVVGTLKAGEYFGEYSCLTGEPRSASVVAATLCELYALDRAALEATIEEWPEVAEEFAKLALSKETPKPKVAEDDIYRQFLTNMGDTIGTNPDDLPSGPQTNEEIERAAQARAQVLVHKLSIRRMASLKERSPDNSSMPGSPVVAAPNKDLPELKEQQGSSWAVGDGSGNTDSMRGGQKSRMKLTALELMEQAKRRLQQTEADSSLQTAGSGSSTSMSVLATHLPKTTSQEVNPLTTGLPQIQTKASPDIKALKKRLLMQSNSRGEQQE